VCGLCVRRNEHHLCPQCNHNRRYKSAPGGSDAPMEDAIPPAPPPVPRRVRAKRPFEQLGPTQRNVRRRLGREALAAIGVPPEELCHHQAAPAALLALSAADRRRIRKVPAMRIPCEKTIIKAKLLLATEHGTQTATFTQPTPGEEENTRDG
jgi:hypothetical protein